MSASPVTTPPTELAVRGLTKVYRLYPRPADRLLELLGSGPRHRALRALDDVTFELPAGQSLGIVGENGAGKSTLLKILSGVTTPTEGSVEVRGTVASLLELGMGFHPDFTGRQNIHLNAAMIGLSEEETREKIPSIIEFSELGHFIDRPVKTYSTGMAMRLGFAVAVQVEPELLIIDEALSVGDGYFQKKCMNRLLEFLDGGGTLLFCSHAMYYVSSFCQRALWLREGRLQAFGNVDEVVREYEGFLASKSEPAETPRKSVSAPGDDEPAAKPARIVGIDFPDLPADQPPHFRHGDPFALELEWEVDDAARAVHLGVGINTASGEEVSAFSTFHEGAPPFVGARRHRVRFEIPELPLVKGEFTLHLFLLDESGLHPYDQVVRQAAFSVASDRYHFGLVSMSHRFAAVETRRSVVGPAAGAS